MGQKVVFAQDTRSRWPYPIAFVSEITVSAAVSSLLLGEFILALCLGISLSVSLIAALDPGNLGEAILLSAMVSLIGVVTYGLAPLSPSLRLTPITTVSSLVSGKPVLRTRLSTVRQLKSSSTTIRYFLSPDAILRAEAGNV